jgi:hypothetical protein
MILNRNNRIATVRRGIAEVAVGTDEFASLKDAMGNNRELFDVLDSRGPYIGLYIPEFRQKSHKMCDSELRLYSECALQLKRDPGQDKCILDFLNMAESALNKIADPTKTGNRRRIRIDLQKRYLPLNVLDNEAHRDAMELQLPNLGEFEFSCQIIANYEMNNSLKKQKSPSF